MKNRNTILFSALFIAALFIATLVSSCKPETTATCTDGVKNGNETSVDCGGSCAVCNTLPVACFNSLPDTILLGASISVDASCSQGAISYLWNFGDGSTANTSAATHAYGSAGSYTVTLTVTNAKGTNTTTKTVAVKITSAQFVGSFQVTEACGLGNVPAYTSTIAASGATQILINNFGNFVTTINLVANVDDQTITLVPQTTSGITITSGVGTIDNALQHITISYFYTDGVNSDNCVMSMTKQ